MRCALLFTTILLFAIVPFSNTATASGLDQNSGITITASFDNSTEMTTLNITMPVTNDASLLDDLKEGVFSIERMALFWAAGGWEFGEVVEIVAQDFQFCTLQMSNSDCSGASFQIEHYPTNHPAIYYTLSVQNGSQYTMVAVGLCGGTPCNETITESVSVENLSASYSDGVTDLTWDYPTGMDKNH